MRERFRFRLPAIAALVAAGALGAPVGWRGPYRVTLLGKRLSCASASRLFARFLDDPDGVLPRPWVLNAQTGTFTRGRGSRTGFRIKPAR